jgi:5-methylcytosine-specific restriction endonuclease McrA
MAIVRDLTGLRFGRLLVVKKAGLERRTDGRNRTTWQCVCDCGNEVVANNSVLVAGSKKSCGCLSLEVSIDKCLRQSERNRKAPEHTALGLVYRSYRASAGQRGYVFEITREDFKALASLPCHYCGVPPSNIKSTAAGDYVYQGLDRVDNNRGYVLDNLVPCCTKCNLSKGTRTLERFLEYRERKLAAIMNHIRGL